MRVLALVVLAACRPAAAPSISHTAPLTRTAPPMLSIAIVEQHRAVAEHGLPAVASDGSVVVYGITELDPGQGLATYRLEVRDRRDNIVATRELLTYDESQAALDTLGAAHPDDALALVSQAPTDAKLAEGNRWLATLHAQHQLVPLTPLPSPGMGDAGEIATTIGDGHVTLAWPGATGITHAIAIAETSTKRELVHRGLPAWNPPSQCALPDPPHRGGPPDSCQRECFVPTRVIGAAFDLSRAIVVVNIGYEPSATGSNCFEGGEQTHVVAW